MAASGPPADSGRRPVKGAAHAHRDGTELRRRFAETAEELSDYEKAGLDIVFVPEAYSFDAVSQLGYLAAKTERVQLASGSCSCTPGPRR